MAHKIVKPEIKKARLWKVFSATALFCVLTLSFSPQVIFARAGGGGSDSVSSSVDSSSRDSSYRGTSTGNRTMPPIVVVIIIGLPVLFIVLFTYATYKQKKKQEQKQNIIQNAASQDSIWNESEIIDHVRQVFFQFQNDWSNFNVDSMKEYLADSYWKRMVLEMNVLKNENRQNLMKGLNLRTVTILNISDNLDNTKDIFTAQVDAQAHDILLDTETNKNLFADTSSFTEYWDFVREGDKWKLNLIRQATESASMRELVIEDFAKRNNFFYDPDFGWLMMPNKGVIFSQSNFQTSDINNHVVGYYRDKIVEFYTFIPDQNSSNYIVAQVALPIKYKDILVKRKNRFLNSDPKGLRRIETESNDFNEKFCLWAHPEDQVNSLELLTPNFMEKIYDLPFELNIEIVGSFLYFYAEGQKDVDYDKMLEILSWAFDEMKM